MSNKIHIEANFAVSDDQREHARHINGLEAATSEYETAIKKVTGTDVKIRIYVRRHKEVVTVAPVAAAPVAINVTDDAKTKDAPKIIQHPRQTAAE